LTAPHESFEKLIPRGGWLREYYEWTLGSEAPAPYHFFVGCATLGAALGRNIWFNKGYYKIWPCLQVLLVGPTGRVRKTSAINLGLKLLGGLTDINVVRDKTTPEELIDSLQLPGTVVGQNIQIPDACGVLAAPELAVLLGKQRYNEGMISLLTSLFDCPDEWSSRTKVNGKIELKNVTITMLGASTPDWLITAIPQDAFGGGFMSRLLFVVQSSTERCYPIPEPPPNYDALLEALREIRVLSIGEFKLSEEAMEWYSQWYATTRRDVPEDEKMAGYHERKPDHMIRLAMIIAAAERRDEIDQPDILQASRLLAYIEAEMLYTFKWLGMKPIGQDQERIIRTLKAFGGEMEHADILRKLIYFMNAIQFKNSMETLTQSGIVKTTVTPQAITYKLISDA
jgi:hypothetical protein